MLMRSLFAVALVAASALSQNPQPPGVRSIGAGCGQFGASTRLMLSQRLRPGAATQLSINGMRPNTTAALWTGWSTTQWGPMALPLGLGFAGMPGCDLLVAPDAPFAFPTGSGTAQAGFGVPRSSVIVGADLGLQVAQYDPTANAAGLVWSHGLEARIGPMPAATSLVSSITQFGISFQFAQPVRAGRFVNGDWFVIGPAQVIAMSPPCTTLNGRVMNGAMVNPAATSKHQGYDSAMYGSGNSQYYVPALNVELGISAANPLTLVPNESLIKSVSNTDPNILTSLRAAAVLTCLAVPPAEGSFRPPYSGNDHDVRYDVTMLDWSALAALQPAAGMPVIATEAARFERPWIDHCPGWPSRDMHPEDNMPDYGRDFTAIYNQATLLCNLAVPQQDRELLLIRLVQIGIDFWGNVQNGCYWEGVGGHGSGRKWPILFAGRLLNDAAMLNVGYSHRTYRNPDGTYEVHFGEDGQTFYVAETAPGVYNWGYGGYTAQHVGLPEFGFSHMHWPQSDHEPWGQDPYRRCCTANAWIGGLLCVRIMGLV
ncbi:MAG: hypothetical protein KDE27_00760, partial [Planctomycetes bacterium]|nr:hypothetical protein [Planctomycetota bacterium]